MLTGSKCRPYRKEKTAEQVNTFIMNSLEELEQDNISTLESKFNHLVYRSGINNYQEQPVLLDPYLPGITSRIFKLLKRTPLGMSLFFFLHWSNVASVLKVTLIFRTSFNQSYSVDFFIWFYHPKLRQNNRPTQWRTNENNTPNMSFSWENHSRQRSKKTRKVLSTWGSWFAFCLVVN